MIQRAVSDEDLGARVYEVNRQRAVDRAFDRMRHGLRADWDYLTTDDHANLRWLLGQLWATRSREDWDALHFSKLDLDRVRRLVGLGDRLHRHGTNVMNGLENAVLIIQASDAGASATAIDEAFAAL